MSNIKSSVKILATNNDEAKAMTDAAEMLGHTVDATTVWTGIVPPNSYRILDWPFRISTAEFYTFRKSNQLPFKEAVMFVCEMLSHFRTSRTEDDVNGIEILEEPRLDLEEYVEYLKPVSLEPEGVKALEVLDEAQKIYESYEVDMTVKFMFIGMLGE